MIYTHVNDWGDAISLILGFPAHEEIEIPKYMLPHPIQVGFTWRIGDNKSQIADFGYALQDKRGIHVREYYDHYTVHWDYIDPTIDCIEHLKQDAPHWLPVLIICGLIAIGLLREFFESN